MPELMARALLPLLILLALQQLGSAGLIKAKAGLAPLMLAKAWEQSLASQGAPRETVAMGGYLAGGEVAGSFDGDLTVCFSRRHGQCSGLWTRT